jgi:hypothetical protein
MKEKPWEDPIVAEVHRIRAELATECHQDLHAYLADLMAKQTGTVTGEELRELPVSGQPALVRETPPKYGAK